jgi:hypothetical protein
MRTVKIVQQPSRSHPHAAVDLETGSVVLQHQDDYALVALCRRLGWIIAIENTAKDYSRRTKSRLVHN